MTQAMNPVDDQLLARITEAVDLLWPEEVRFLEELVRFPSTLGNEREAQECVAQTFNSLGLEVDSWNIDLADIEGLPGFSPVTWSYADKLNVVGALRPKRSTGRSLILNSHIDVVPAGPESLWSHPPFEPVIKDGRMYGRGAGDMKAGLAAMSFALRALLTAGYHPAAEVYLQSVVEEECTGNGALACLQRGYWANAAIIPEPFDQTLLVAQLGVMWVHIGIHGTPTHVLEAGKGANAIALAQLLVQDLMELEKEWNDAAARHPAYSKVDHPINFNVGRIDGGEWPSSVPASCNLSVRIGFFPGVSTAEVRAAIEQRVREFASRHEPLRVNPPVVSYSGFQAEGCTFDPAQDMMQKLSALHEQIGGQKITHLASTATTDARYFRLYGDMPVTCYGPQASNIHGIDESVDLGSIKEVTVILALFIAQWCGIAKS